MKWARDLVRNLALMRVPMMAQELGQFAQIYSYYLRVKIKYTIKNPKIVKEKMAGAAFDNEELNKQYLKVGVAVG